MENNETETHAINLKEGAEIDASQWKSARIQKVKGKEVRIVFEKVVDEPQVPDVESSA